MEVTDRTNLDRIREYGQALEQDPDTFAFVRLADAFREEGMLSAAADICRQGLARHPDYATAHIVMAEILEAQGDLERAIEAYDTSVRLDPQNIVARTGLGRLLVRVGRTEEARLQLEYALFMSPGHREAQELLDAAEGRRPLPKPTRLAPARPGRPEAQAAPTTPEPSSLDRALALVTSVEGVAGAMIVGADGLPMACSDRLLASSPNGHAGEDTLGAMVAEIYAGTRRYVERLDMGGVRRVLIEGAAGKLVIAASTGRAVAAHTRGAAPAQNDYILLVATEPLAKLGLVNRQIDGALACLAER